MSAVQTAQTQAAATPDSTLLWLREGNERFVGGRPARRDLLAQAATTAADGQHPLAAVLGCVDSRVPVETVLDLGIGDAFVARTAGNVVGGDVLGSLEFATALAGVTLVVVLGHTSCGAVKGACDGVELGALTGLLAKITPAVEEVTGGDPAPGSDDAALVDEVVVANVRRQVAAVLASDVVAGLVEDGELAVVGAVYDLPTGVVRWLADA